MFSNAVSIYIAMREQRTQNSIVKREASKDRCQHLRKDHEDFDLKLNMLLLRGGKN